MEETDYWLHLERRVCRGLRETADEAFCHLWCDGIVPESYRLDAHEPYIAGHAWICNGPRQDKWAFTLLLPRTAVSRDNIEWVSLLPPENARHWLSLDKQGKHIDIDPAART